MVTVASVLVSAGGNCDILTAFLTVMPAAYSGKHIVVVLCSVVTLVSQLTRQL